MDSKLHSKSLDLENWVKVGHQPSSVIPCKECSSLDSMKFSNMSMLMQWGRLVLFFKHFDELR